MLYIIILDVASIKVPLLNFTPPKKEIVVFPSIHEQDDGIIFALCATGTSSKDSLLSWIRLLENDGNPALGTIPIVFTLKSAEKEIIDTRDQENLKNIKDH